MTHLREELKTALQDEPKSVGVRSRLGTILWEHSTQNLQLLCGMVSILRGVWFLLPHWLPRSAERAVFFFLGENPFGVLFIVAGCLQVAIALFDTPRSRWVYLVAMFLAMLKTYALVCFWIASPWMLMVPGMMVFLFAELWIAASALRERKIR